MRSIITFLFIFIVYTGTAFAAPFAYVAINDQNSVAVIDVATNQVVDTVDVGSEPMAAASTVDGMFVYVANSSSNNVSVIEVSSNQVTDTIAVGNAPIAVAVTPDGDFVYVVNSDDNSVSIIDTSSNDVVETVTVGTNPSAIAIGPNPVDPPIGFAYVTNRDDNTISVIDPTSMEVTTTIGGAGQEPVAIAITPDNVFAFVGDVNSDTLTIFNLTSNTIQSTIDLSDGVNSGSVGCMQINSVGFLFLNWANQTLIVDTELFEVDSRLDVDGVCLAIAPGNDPIYVSNNGDNNVSITEAATSFNLVGTITVAGQPQGIAIAPPVIAVDNQGSGNGSCALAAQGSNSSSSLLILLIIPAVIILLRTRRIWLNA